MQKKIGILTHHDSSTKHLFAYILNISIGIYLFIQQYILIKFKYYPF